MHFIKQSKQALLINWLRKLEVLYACRTCISLARVKHPCIQEPLNMTQCYYNRQTSLVHRKLERCKFCFCAKQQKGDIFDISWQPWNKQFRYLWLDVLPLSCHIAFSNAAKAKCEFNAFLLAELTWITASSFGRIVSFKMIWFVMNMFTLFFSVS